MMSDAIDETLDKDEAEEETEDLTNQVLDEIGVGVASQVRFSLLKQFLFFFVSRVSKKTKICLSLLCLKQLSSAPKGRIATKTAAPPASTTTNNK